MHCINNILQKFTKDFKIKTSSKLTVSFKVAKLKNVLIHLGLLVFQVSKEDLSDMVAGIITLICVGMGN